MRKKSPEGPLRELSTMTGRGSVQSGPNKIDNLTPGRFHRRESEVPFGSVLMMMTETLVTAKDERSELITQIS